MKLSDMSSDMLCQRKEFARAHLGELHTTLKELEAQLCEARRAFTEWHNIYAQADAVLAEREKVTRVRTGASGYRSVLKVQDRIKGMSKDQIDTVLKALIGMQKRQLAAEKPSCDECNDLGWEDEPCPVCGKEKCDE